MIISLLWGLTDMYDQLLSLNKAQNLHDDGSEDAALDLIYDQVDDLLRAGEFDYLDSCLFSIEPYNYNTDLLLALLTTTLPVKNSLIHRSEFTSKVCQELRNRNYDDSLVDGLI